MMYPNQNFLKYFPDAELPVGRDRTDRSSCLKIGTWIVVRKIVQQYRLDVTLGDLLDEKDLGLFLDLAAYSIVTENNAGQYYPNYAYIHPLFTKDMRIYSDSKVSDMLKSLTDDQSIGFLNEWNANRNHREKIYISYDSTNKNCQAGDIEMVEYGHPKNDCGLPVFNYALAYDTYNKEPLFYEKYPGSITDVSQLQFMLDKAKGCGYKKLGFILDRGYFSKANIRSMDSHGYSFVIMVKGMASFVNELILSHKGGFENKWKNHIDDYDVYGMTLTDKLYEDDEVYRYFHIYHSILKEGSERTNLAARIRQMKTFLMKHTNQVMEFGPIFHKYFILHYNEQNGIFQFPEERTDVIESENALSGYFCIITSGKMTAKQAIELYKSRDASEKLFRGDKSYLGYKSLRVHSDASAASKIFVEFVALIIRSRIYTCLMEEMRTMGKRPNYMTVPAAIGELEKIEMVRQADNIYRLDHAITAHQKTILNAFGIDAAYVKHMAACIGKELAQAVKPTGKE
jgi:transposase